MKYVLCFLLPPLAVFATGRPISAALNFFLTLCFYFPGAIHACLVVSADERERQHAEMMSAITGQNFKPAKSSETMIVAGLVIAVMLLVVVSVLFAAFVPERKSIEAEAAPVPTPVLVEPWKPGPKHEEFIKTIQDVYDVKSAQFMNDELLRVIFLPEADESTQGTCQAIANLWAVKQPQPRVDVEAWNEHKHRLATASVINGKLITPPPPTGRRSTAGRAAVLAEKHAAEMRSQLTGKAYADVVAAHGEPKTKDASTGWAVWGDFRARFEGGKAVEVMVK